MTVSISEGGQRPGLTLSLQPAGCAAQGAGMLWQDQVYRPLGLGPESAGGAVHAQVSYRLRLPKRLLVAAGPEALDYGLAGRHRHLVPVTACGNPKGPAE